MPFPGIESAGCRGVARVRSRWGIAAVVFTALAGCADPNPRPRDVLFITLDTVRADHLGCLGSPDARTPVLDAWARGGVLSRDCIVDVPLTLPSHTSMMTGIPALAHGVRVNGESRLADAATTLAEELAAHEYATDAVVSSLVLDARYGLAQGFAHYDDSLAAPYVPQDESRFPADRHWLPEKDRRADEAVTKAIARLEAHRGERRPLFLWLHLYDAHFPYDPRAPWNRALPTLYDAEIAGLDRELVRLARLVERAERSRPMALVVTADHGEGLGDHGEDEHGVFVYDETVRVPLVVRAPGAIPEGAILDAQVRTIDLAATTLDLALGEVTDRRFGDGGSLCAALRGRGAVPDPVAYSESIQSKLSYSGSGVKAVRTVARKWVASARPESFDLSMDPGERGEASAPPSGEVGAIDELRLELRGRVERALAKGALTEPLAPNAAADAALRSLGYVVSGESNRMPRTVEAELRFDGFDPKDLVLVALAGRDLENGFLESAEAKLARFIETSPSLEARPDLAPIYSLAHQNLAKAAMMRRHFERAAAEYELALAAEGGNPDAAAGIVFAWNLAGRPEVAERRGRELLRIRPADDRLALHVGIAAALAGRPKDAVAALEALAARAKDAETGHVARLYAEKIAGGEGDRYLRTYLESS